MPRGRARQNMRRWRRLEWDEITGGIQERQPQQDPEPVVIIEPDEPEVQVVQCVAEPVQVLYAEVQHDVRPRVVQQVREVRSRQDITKINRLETEVSKLKEVTDRAHKVIDDTRIKVAKGVAFEGCSETINEVNRTLWEMPMDARDYYVAIPCAHQEGQDFGVPCIKDKASQKFLGKYRDLQLHITADVWFSIPCRLKVIMMLGDGLVEQLKRLPAKFVLLLHKLVFNDAKALEELIHKICATQTPFKDIVDWIADETKLPYNDQNPVPMEVQDEAQATTLEQVIDEDKWETAKRQLFQWLDER